MNSPKLEHQGMRNIWLSPRDAVGAFRAAIEKENLGYGIANATSLTGVERLALQPARELLNWEPQDKSSDLPHHEAD